MVVKTSETAPIFVNFVEAPNWPQGYGKIGMTFAPGKVQAQSMTGCAWDRDLDMDLDRLKKEYKTHSLVSLMRDNEYKTYKIDGIFEKAKLHDINLIHYPILDGSVPPSNENVLPLIKDIANILKEGGNVVVHCLGGLGRTGLIVACVVEYILKIEPKEAIEMVRKARKGTIQTFGQVNFVEDFSKFLSGLQV